MTDIIPAHGQGPWRIVILDRDPDDPRWLLATITLASDVRPAALDSASRYQDWPAVTDWVAAQAGVPQAALVPMHDVLAWRLDEGGQPR